MKLDFFFSQFSFFFSFGFWGIIYCLVSCSTTSHLFHLHPCMFATNPRTIIEFCPILQTGSIIFLCLGPKQFLFKKSYPKTQLNLWSLMHCMSQPSTTQTPHPCATSDFLLWVKPLEGFSQFQWWKLVNPLFFSFRLNNGPYLVSLLTDAVSLAVIWIHPPRWSSWHLNYICDYMSKIKIARIEER